MEHKLQQNLRNLCAIGIAGAAGLVGFAIYNFNYFFKEDFTEEEIDKMENIREDIKKHDGDLSLERAIELMAFINKKTDERFEKIKVEFYNRRIAQFDNEEEYENICKEMFEKKESLFNEITEKVFEKIEVESLDKIQKILKKVSPFAVETRAYEYYHPKIDENYILDTEKIKQAFLYYGKKFREEMYKVKKFKAEYNQLLVQQDDLLLFKLLVLKTRVEDKFNKKYSCSESEIRYLLYKYDMYKDKDVKEMHDEISEFDEMISPSELI